MPLESENEYKLIANYIYDKISNDILINKPFVDEFRNAKLEKPRLELIQNLLLKTNMNSDSIKPRMVFIDKLFESINSDLKQGLITQDKATHLRNACLEIRPRIGGIEVQIARYIEDTALLGNTKLSNAVKGLKGSNNSNLSEIQQYKNKEQLKIQPKLYKENLNRVKIALAAKLPPIQRFIFKHTGQFGPKQADIDVQMDKIKPGAIFLGLEREYNKPVEGNVNRNLNPNLDPTPNRQLPQRIPGQSHPLTNLAQKPKNESFGSIRQAQLASTNKQNGDNEHVRKSNRPKRSI